MSDLNNSLFAIIPGQDNPCEFFSENCIHKTHTSEDCIKCIRGTIKHLQSIINLLNLKGLKK